MSLQHELSAETRERKHLLGICDTAYCRKPAVHHRRKCAMCRCRLYDRPLKRMWRNLRGSAKRRCIAEAIPWECFELWAACNGYNQQTAGRGSSSLTVDRILPFPRLGYMFANMQALTKADNTRKRYVDAKLYAHLQQQTQNTNTHANRRSNPQEKNPPQSRTD